MSYASIDFEELHLAEFVEGIAFAVARAQVALDRNAAALVKELAETSVVIHAPRVLIDQTVGEDGETIAREARTVDAPFTTNLLSLGIRPTFYQFARTTIDVALDLSTHEEVEKSDDQTTKRHRVLTVNTGRVQRERRYTRSVEAHSRLTIELVPVPPPAALTDLGSLQAGTTTVRKGGP